MEMELQETMGTIKLKTELIIKQEGKVLFRRDVVLVKKHIYEQYKLTPEQIELIEAAKRARYGGAPRPSTSSNNQPLLAETLSQTQKRAAVVTYSPPKPLLTAQYPTPPPPKKRFQKTFVDDEDFKEDESVVKARALPFKEEEELAWTGTRKNLADDFSFTPATITPVALKRVATPPAAKRLPVLAPGYENVGFVSCFCNAVIRALVSLDHLNLALETRIWRAETTPINSGLATACRAFRAKEPFNPSRVILPLLPRFHRSASQEDAHEFLLGLLDGAERELVLPMPLGRGEEQEHANKLAKVPTHQVFSSNLEKQLTCLDCKTRRRAGNETYLVHSLAIPASSSSSSRSFANASASLQQLFLRSLRCEEVEDFACEARCNRAKRTASISLQFATAPQVLVLHLKRHEQTALDGIRKNSAAVDIPLELDIPAEYVAPEAAIVPLPVRYVLSAVVFHTGSSPRSGHYTTVGRRSTKQNDWMLFDDTATTAFDPRAFTTSSRYREDSYLYVYSYAGA